MAESSTFYNPYDSEDWDSDEEWDIKDCRNLSIADAQEIADHLKENRKIAPYMYILQQSRLTKEVLDNTDLGPAVARHQYHEGCGALVRSTLPRLVRISKGLPDHINDNFFKENGNWAKVQQAMERLRKRASLSPNSGESSDSGDRSPVEPSNCNFVAQSLEYCHAPSTSGMSSDKDENRSSLAQKKVVPPSKPHTSIANHPAKNISYLKQAQKELQKRAKETDKASKQETKVRAKKRKTDASSDAPSAKVVKTESQVKKRVAPSLEALEVLKSVSIKPEPCRKNAQKVNSSRVDADVHKELVAIQAKFVRKMEQLKAEGAPPEPHSAAITDTEASHDTRSAPFNNVPLNVKKTNKDEDKERRKVEKKKRKEEERRQREEEAMRQREREDKKRLCEEMERQHLEAKKRKSVTYQNPSPLVKLTIFSPTKAAPEKGKGVTWNESSPSAPQYTSPPSVQFKTPISPAEVVARQLRELPQIPEEPDFREMLKTLRADVLREAEKLIGRQMGRVDRIWWEILWRDFGLDYKRLKLPIRDLYMAQVEMSAKQNAVTHNDDDCMLLPPPPPPPF